MSMQTRSRPDETEYAAFYTGYINAVPEGDIVALLRQGGEELVETVRAIPETRGGYRYANDKWSIKQVVGHVIDAERIFSYRALCLARGETAPLPKFEEDDYARNAGSDARSLADLVAELRAVRESTVLLIASFGDDAWTRRGTVSGREISVRALAYITAGHSRHHLQVLRERYLAS